MMVDHYREWQGQGQGQGGNSGAEAKRRKLRKGTRSCWECKRRKTRCIFSSPDDALCIGCRRRGTSCVGQEYPEEARRPPARSADDVRLMSHRIVRVEALVEQLVQKLGAVVTPPIGPAVGSLPSTVSAAGLPVPTPQSMPWGPASYSANSMTSSHDSSHSGSAVPTPGPAGPAAALTGAATSHSQRLFPTVSAVDPPWESARFARISEALYAALPSPQDTSILCRSASQFSVLFHQMLATPYSEIGEDGFRMSKMLDVPPNPHTHPVLLARRMLVFATMLQYLPPGSHTQIGGLSEHPQIMMKRLVDTASRLVTSDDELMGTVESLECVMLEGCYQANTGNLRRAWMIFRRAMLVSQLMGLHQDRSQALSALDPDTRIHPSFVWYRIVYSDRYLSLMLGLPQGTLDTSMADEANLAKDIPMGCLERIHCVVVSRILDRNERDPSSLDHDLASTLEIDRVLQDAAKRMPSKWWLLPDLMKLSNSQDRLEIFWETLRMVDQIFHYHVVLQLHLPFLLHASADQQYDYSKAASISASREVLSRFISFRSFNRVSYACRTVDFFALMAAMALLLAHIDGHRREPHGVNFLAHQRMGDRAMMEQVLDSMDAVAQANMEVLSRKSGELLRRLLTVEAYAAEGDASPGGTAGLGGSSVGPGHGHGDDPGLLRMYIPYFGTISVTREGRITRVASGSSREPAQQPLGMEGSGDGADQVTGTLPAIHTKISISAGSSATSIAPIPAAGVPPVAASSSGGGKEGVVKKAPFERWQQQGQQEDDDEEEEEEDEDEEEEEYQPPPEQGQQPQEHPSFAPQFPGPITEALQQHLYPGLTAGVDDWAFQGVDMAFFDNLMRCLHEKGGDGVDGTGWSAW